MKRSVCILFSFILCFSISNIVCATSRDEAVVRSVITSIEWIDETGQIVVNKIIIQKVKDQEVQTYESNVTINDDSLREFISSDEQAVKYVHENQQDVFYRDTIFGEKVETFKDLS